MFSVAALYPSVEPYDGGWLEVGDGQRVYWEECGHPAGKPAVFLHGGPGGKSSPLARRFFDPSRYRLLLMDQRGCGRSVPHASDPAADFDVNTTWHLVKDLETLRQHRGVERWLLFGGSWGSALALAYAETHPDRVSELVLFAIFTVRRRELDWYYNGGAAAMCPERYELLLQPLGGPGFEGDVIAAYRRLLFDPDPAIHLPAAVAWATWEGSTVTLVEDSDMISSATDPHSAVASARLECHYFTHAGWLSDDQLIGHAHRLATIPGAIVQGRYDLVTPAKNAWELSRAWPAADLQIIPDEGHVGPQVFAALVAATDHFAA
ncbi:MAG TPA: prolyl aminopeptidase [Microlunatus sp.]|nr:prolyl aminopeptidase [Microlunatus sp.]